MNNTGIKQTLLQAICDNTKLGQNAFELNEADSLLNSGVDSYQMTRIIIQIEDSLSIKFADDDLILMDFNTVGDFISSIEKTMKSREG